VSLGQLKVMSAIESCRTAALGGHVSRCEKCTHTQISYNSCLMGKSINGELAIGLVANLPAYRVILRCWIFILLTITQQFSCDRCGASSSCGRDKIFGRCRYGST
jgi:hypothetical protein